MLIYVHMYKGMTTESLNFDEQNAHWLSWLSSAVLGLKIFYFFIFAILVQIKNLFSDFLQKNYTSLDVFMLNNFFPMIFLDKTCLV